MIQLHHGDCLDILPKLADGSVDAIVTDPPYAQTNEAYDNAIACNPEVWRECYRIAKPNAALISFAGSPTYHRIASAIEAGGWRVRQMWGWIYRDGLITSAWPKEGFDRLAPAMDPICYATKGKVLLSLDRVPGSDWKRPACRPGVYSDRSSHIPSKAFNGNWPHSIISDGCDDFQYFALSRTNPTIRREKAGHPNQKPLALMRWIISKLPGSAILDLFLGSGTTAIAVIEEDRDFIGIERDPQYFAIAERRIQSAQASTPLLDRIGATP